MAVFGAARRLRDARGPVAVSVVQPNFFADIDVARRIRNHKRFAAAEDGRCRGVAALRWIDAIVDAFGFGYVQSVVVGPF
jgi:hypothetical protein